ncbi:MAG: peptidylprolyl isomerase [Candidatus Cloacimonetes bacterium]|nr:peptidylprolyl isomerase [Candidatus Cloacimonadota bacterium]
MKNLILRFFLTVFLLIAFWLFAEQPEDAVVMVGSEYITTTDIENAWDTVETTRNTSYHRQLVLKKLIEQKLLTLYASEQQIKVDTQEVESYFISIYGDHERFLTNGRFDYLKFEDFKHSETAWKIFLDLKTELLGNKTKSIIRNRLDMDDDKLLERYLIEHFQFDISYIIIEDELVYVPTECTPYGGWEYYRENKDRFFDDRKVKIKIVVVPDTSFARDVSVSQEFLTSYYQESGLEKVAPFSEVADSLLHMLKQDQMHNLAREQANTCKLKLIQDDLLDGYVFRSDEMSYTSKLGLLKNGQRIVVRAFEMPVGKTSEIFDIGTGWLVFKVLECKENEPASMEQMGQLVWKSYVEYQKKNIYPDKFRKYYSTHIDSFKTLKAYLTYIEINPRELDSHRKITEKQMREYFNANILDFSVHRTPKFEDVRDEVRYQMTKEERNNKAQAIGDTLYRALFDDVKLDRLLSKHSLTAKSEMVFLKKFSNHNPLHDLIASHISDPFSQEVGYLYFRDSIVLYRINSLYPGFLPEYDEISDQIHRLMPTDDLMMETNLRLYYELNKDSFVIPDSVQLTLIHFPLDKAAISVSSNQKREFYKMNIEKFRAPHAFRFNYVYIADPYGTKQSFTQDVQRRVLEYSDLHLAQQVLGSESELPQNQMDPVDELAPEFSNTLSDLHRGQISEAIYYGNGWYIFEKLGEQKAHNRSYNEVERDIDEQIRRKEADSFAYLNAKTVFDSTEYLSQTYRFVDSTQVITTPFQEITKEFPLLGSVMPYAKQLSRTYKGTKYHSIQKVEDGYVIIFMSKRKIASKKVTFEEMLPVIRKQHREEGRQNHIKGYLREIIKELHAGADPDSFLVFFGKWRSAKGLTIDSEIPGIKFSKDIFEDILNRRQGDFSHPIQVSENSYMFYYLDKLNKVSKYNFYREKDI